MYIAGKKTNFLTVLSAVIFSGLLGCSCTESSRSDLELGQGEAMIGDLEIRIVNSSNLTMADCQIEFNREGKKFRFENVEGGNEILILAEGVSIPPDFIVKWHVLDEGGNRAGRTNWFWYGTYRSEEWDIEKTKFTVEFNEDLSATSGRQE